MQHFTQELNVFLMSKKEYLLNVIVLKYDAILYVFIPFIIYLALY